MCNNGLNINSSAAGDLPAVARSLVQFSQTEISGTIADKIGLVNKKLGAKIPYLLLGPGRWGTSDPWLGIPVNWEQISNAKSMHNLHLIQVVLNIRPNDNLQSIDFHLSNFLN